MREYSQHEYADHQDIDNDASRYESLNVNSVTEERRYQDLGGTLA